jgi:NAD(P)-dependent dehydrogenase (short-subunit alcohol dehydrogenase family)
MQTSPAAGAAAASVHRPSAPSSSTLPRADASRQLPAAAAVEPAAVQAAPPAGPRIALVTGAARRLGRAIALALAGDGWDIGVHYATSEAEARDTANAIRALGRRAVCLGADLQDEQATRGLLKELAGQLGPVCGLVNNASRFVHDDIGSVDTPSLLAHLMPNLVAPLLLSQAFLEGLGKAPAAGTGEGNHREGVIVNLLDQKLYNLNPDFLSYTVAKAGLAAATTMLAQALAPRVRVVGVAPGLTFPSYLQDPDAFRRACTTYSPLGRSSTPEDVAAAVVFAMNNRSMTGTVIQVDGGQHLQCLPRDASLMPAGER